MNQLNYEFENILYGRNYVYKILYRLRSVTNGTIYLACVYNAGSLKGELGSISTKSFVTIKETRDDSNVDPNTLFEEAKIISTLDHPNIVKVLECFKRGSKTYMVMEYFGKRNLYSIIPQNVGLPPLQALDMILQIGSAVSYMNSKKHTLLQH